MHHRGRALIFVDALFVRRDGEVYTGNAFWLFLRELIPAFDRATVLGRLSPESVHAPYRCTGTDVAFRALPYYRSLRSWAGLLGALPGCVRLVRSELARHDVVVLGVPHPLALVIGALARWRGITVVSIDRQDLVHRVRHRTTGAGRLPMVLAAHGLVAWTARLARGGVTFVVGGHLRERYLRPGADVHTLLISLVRSASVARDPRCLPRIGVPRLLWVGRLDPDKDLWALLDTFEAVSRMHTSVVLDIAGAGSLESRFREEARRRGLAARVELHGYVPHGPRLDALYDRATVFVYPARQSEGFPQVLLEAAARGLPVVTSAVAGIPYVLEHGRDALVFPRTDAGRMSEGVRRLLSDGALYRRLSERGLRIATDHTLETQRTRFVRALRRHVPAQRVRAMAYRAGETATGGPR